MNKKLIIIYILSKNIWLYSQSIGLGLGGDLNLLETNISGLTFSEISPGIGSNYQIKFIDKVYIFSWETGLGVIEKNYSISRTDKFSGSHNTYKNTYIHLPVKIHYNLVNKTKFKFYINTGAFIGYWFYSRQSGVLPNVFNTSNIIYENGEISQSFKFQKYDAKNKFNSIKDNRIELGISSGIQATHNIFEKYDLLLGINYYRALTNQQKEYMLNHQKRVNSTISFEVGIMFYLNRKKTHSDA